MEHLMQRLTRVSLVVAVFALLAAACGGSSQSASSSHASTSSKPVNQWTAGICTDVAAWAKTLQAAGATASSAITTTAGDITAPKQALVKVLDDSVSATDKLISQLAANGAPDVPNGQKIQTQVLGAFRDGRQVFADALTKAQALSTSDSTAFVDAAKQVSTSISSGFDTVGKVFNNAGKLDTGGTIDRAGKTEPACKAING
jgi:hypothetical protein